MAVKENPSSQSPARRVVLDAIATNDRAGHDNLGSLSFSHGFIPRAEPRRSLPASHAAWDQIAAAIPTMFREYTTRREVDRLPVLSAAEADLPDEDVLRASAIFSILAHAYWYADPTPPAGIPSGIQRPWEELTRRLARPAPHLSFIDLNTHNWHFIDPRAADPFASENLRLAVPMVGNEDERRFQMVPVEMVYRFSPMLAAVCDAQDAVLADDPRALADRLVFIGDALRYHTFELLQKVNPNPYAARHYVNPVVWGKTAALFASPFQKEYVPGPSGTAIPSFTTLDLFFGRKSFKTTVGRETHETRNWFPRFWREWLDAVEGLSIPDYVARRGDKELAGVYEETKDAYAGESGLIARHRLKAYGYLDLSFKAGRVKTLGGFAGRFSERVWDRMANVLEETRRERYDSAPKLCHAVPVKRVEALRRGDGPAIHRVVLDVSGTGIRYAAGDRCGVLPESAPEVIERTLRALRATGDEPISLDAPWRAHVLQRHGYENAQVLPLRTLLRFGRLAPLDRAVVLGLSACSSSERLRRIVDARAEDQWDLADALTLLAEGGYDARRLWKAVAGDREHICHIVPPERWRLYSISSVMDDPRAHGASEIHLTVGELAYHVENTGVSRARHRVGTASGFLARAAEPGAVSRGRVSIRVVRPPRFSLPGDPARPVVMIAGGTGVAPMLALARARARTPGAGPTWLFLAVRTAEELEAHEELAPLVAAGTLRLTVAVSRATDGTRRRIDEEMLKPEHAAELWRLLRAAGHVYICGRTTLANTVVEALRAIITRNVGDGAARETLYRLVGEDRLLMEIFTTYGGAQFDDTKMRITASELAARNNERDGYWMAISGRVYDVTEFGHIHPGGLKIIQSYAGMDATYAYQVIQHHANPEVDAMLGMYERGVLREPDFGQVWGVALSDRGLRFVPLRDVYRAWADLLYMVVEMENGIANDLRMRNEPFTDAEPPGHVMLTPIKAQRLGQTHSRLVDDYLPLVLGDPLDALWRMTLGVVGRVRLDAGWMRATMDAVRAAPDARTCAGASARLDRSLREGNTDFGSFCDELAHEDTRVLAELKESLCRGARVFETHERDTARHGQQLLDALASVPPLIEAFNARVARAAAGLPGVPKPEETEPPSFTIAADVGLGHGSNAERAPKA
jgi:sulfite reductase (NADPH) flavoprotein alpha-component